VNEFVVLSGYKGQQIREYFANFWLNQADITFDLKSSSTEIIKSRGLPWKVTVLDTGLETNTGGRIARLANSISDNFYLTYGDGVSDVDISKLLNQHQINRTVVTLTAVQPPARFGALELLGSKVNRFREKPEGNDSWVNGGFFVLSPKIFKYLKADSDSFEMEILPKLAEEDNLGAYKHSGFWQPVDSIRDLQSLEEAIKIGRLPWA
jgi:glucose-1-phosphate cytidylyltransferase